MYKNIILICICVLITSCSKNNLKQAAAREYVLSIDFSETRNTRVFLSDFTKNGVEAIDSAFIENNKVIFKGKVNYPSRYVIKTNNTRGHKLLILTNDSIHIKISGDKIAEGKIIGSGINDTMLAHQKHIRRTYKKVDAFFPDIQRARLANDANTLQNISHKIKKIEQEVLEINFTFAKIHPDSFISAMILNDISKRDSVIDLKRIKSLYHNLSPTVKKGKDAKELSLFLNTISDH